MTRYHIDGSGEAEEGITVETSMGMVTVKTDEWVLGELRSTTVVLTQARAVDAARALANAAADLDLERADPFRPSATPAASLPDPDPTWGQYARGGYTVATWSDPRCHIYMMDTSGTPTGGLRCILVNGHAEPHRFGVGD